MHRLKFFTIVFIVILIDIQMIQGQTYRGTLNGREVLWSSTEKPDTIELFDNETKQSLGFMTKIVVVYGEKDFEHMDGCVLTTNVCCYSIKNADGTSLLFAHIMEHKHFKMLKSWLKLQNYDSVEIAVSSQRLGTWEWSNLVQHKEKITSLSLIKCEIPENEVLPTGDTFPKLKDLVLVLNQMEGNTLEYFVHWIRDSRSIQRVYWHHNLPPQMLALMWRNPNIQQITVQRPSKILESKTVP